MKSQYTHIAIVLDRSGSMQSTRDDAIGGFNTFLEEQKKAPGEATLTLVGFDDRYEVWQDFAPLASASALTEETFVPRGTTALLDAIGRTVAATGDKLAAMPEDARPDKVIVVIVTDGGENASTAYSGTKINEMIAHQTAKYGWLFMFIGSNQDAITTAAAMGIGAAHSLTAASSADGTRMAYASMSRVIRSSRAGKVESFTDEDRDAQSKAGA